MKLLHKRKPDRSKVALVGVALALAAVTAGWVQRRARQAERDDPPEGHLLDIDGVRLHYVERGAGPPVVLIHGNMVSHRDFDASGLIERLARRHRVIAFDRPGFGHSTRPRDRLWTPTAQGKLLREALVRLGIERPVLVGHSMGAMVALAMALDYPAEVRKLVVLGGYYFPNIRVDALLTAPVALPVIGDVLRYTITALSARLMLNRAIGAMFAPKKVPLDFLPTLSREMMLRPMQLRANAEDAAFMIGAARVNSARHHELKLPVVVFAGAEDAVIDVESNPVRLHHELSQSKLVVVPGAGHMVHYSVADEIVAAVHYDLPLHAGVLEIVSTPLESEAISA